MYQKVQITVTPTPVTPSISSNSPVNVGDTIKLSTQLINGISYLWIGPNGFTSTAQNPKLPNVNSSMAGTYQLRDSINGCVSQPSSVTVAVNANSIVSGTFITAINKSIPNVTLNITGGVNNTGLYNGGYSFNLLPSNKYTLRPSKNNDKKKANGVSTIDISLIQSHILKKSPLNSPYKLIAADANNDKKITSIDITYIKRVNFTLHTHLIIIKE